MALTIPLSHFAMNLAIETEEAADYTAFSTKMLAAMVFGGIAR